MTIHGKVNILRQVTERIADNLKWKHLAAPFQTYRKPEVKLIDFPVKERLFAPQWLPAILPLAEVRGIK